MRAGRFGRSWWAVWALVGLSGCAGVGPVVEVPARQPLTVYTLEGRFAVNQQERSAAGRLSWRHDGSDDEILIQDPFGRGLAELRLTPGSAVLRQSDGTVQQAHSPSALALTLFGIELPLDQLAHWLTARPVAMPVRARFDAVGRLSAGEFADWAITYDYPDAARADVLPTQVSATRADGVAVRVRIDRWDLGEPGR